MAWENDAPRLGLASMRRSAPRAAKAARLQLASQPARRQRRRRGGPGSTAGLASRGLQLAAHVQGGWMAGTGARLCGCFSRLLALRRCRWALSDQIRKVRSKCIGDRRRERGPHSTFCRCAVRVRIHYAARPPSSPPPPLQAAPTRLPPRVSPAPDPAAAAAACGSTAASGRLGKTSHVRRGTGGRIVTGHGGKERHSIMDAGGHRRYRRPGGNATGKRRADRAGTGRGTRSGGSAGRPDQ